MREIGPVHAVLGIRKIDLEYRRIVCREHVSPQCILLRNVVIAFFMSKTTKMEDVHVVVDKICEEQ